MNPMLPSEKRTGGLTRVTLGRGRRWRRAVCNGSNSWSSTGFGDQDDEDIDSGVRSPMDGEVELGCQ